MIGYIVLMSKLWKTLKLTLLAFSTSTAWKMVVVIYLVAVIGGLAMFIWQQSNKERLLIAAINDSQEIVKQLSNVAQEYEALRKDDQIAINASLSAEIKNIENTYREGASLFEARADLTGTNKAIDYGLAKFLNLLADKKWVEAQEQSKSVQNEIDKAIVAAIPKVSSTPLASSNTLPASGYARQKVMTNRGEFVVSMIVSPGARAIVETASDNDCLDSCPTKTLAEHVAASGGFAGINGSYFCPPDYSQCQGKTNSFDTLAVNGRTKAVLNRANNVYSTIPLVAFYGGNVSFYDQTVQWGIDTSGGGALANYPRLLRDGNLATGDEGKRGTKGFIGVKDGIIVIGHVFGATNLDAGEVLKTLGLSNAINLDGGGSSALYYEGSYKVGPGRNLPTAIVLVR